MATSNVIDEIKKKIVKAIMDDDEIISVIDSPDRSKEGYSAYCLTDTKVNREKGFIPILFTYIKYPNVIEDTITFLGIEANIVGHYNYTNTWSKVQIEVWIFSHKNHMRIDNIPGITANRNDYLAELIEAKVKETLDYFSDVYLYSNIGAAYNDNFLYRKLIFECSESNFNLCSDGLQD